RSRAHILKIPILVEIDDYKAAGEMCSACGSIAYCGTLNEHKDGVVTLMRAYASIARRFPDVGLCLIGDSYVRSQIPEYRRIATDFDIADRVTFTGSLRREEVPRHLTAARALALARPSSAQAAAGFPTKLGEYLATGNPVVITCTGEI